MANPDPTLEQEIGLAVHKAFQKHANRGWVRGGDKLSELMSDVAKSISPIFESHLNKAVENAKIEGRMSGLMSARKYKGTPFEIAKKIDRELSRLATLNQLKESR